MNLKNLSDAQLSEIMVNYITQVKNLMNNISKYLYEEKNKALLNLIKDQYKSLKTQLLDYANYVNLQANKTGSKLYTCYFVPSISEARAYGFTKAINSKIDNQMYNAVEEAHYKLTKYKDLSEWQALVSNSKI